MYDVNGFMRNQSVDLLFQTVAAALVVAMLVLAAGFNLMRLQPCNLTHISEGEINRNEGENN